MASVSIDAYVDRNQVTQGETFRLVIETKGETISNFTIPSLPPMSFTSLGSSRSSASSYSIIGGRMTSEKKESITFSLRADNTGNLSIPPISVQVNGQTILTKPIAVQVLTANTQQQSQQNQQNLQSQQNQQQIRQQGTQTETFLLATVDKKTVYTNEMFIVSFKLYTQNQIQNISFAGEPAFSGFWKEELYQVNRIQWQREIYNNTQYNTTVLRTIALFPSREGSLIIPEMALDIDIITPARNFWEFSSSRSVRVVSSPINITVISLPPLEATKNFIGAVGKFSINSSISSNEGETGNSLTYRIELNGIGNFNQTKIPKVPDIRGLKFLPPEIQDEKTSTNTQFSGKRTFLFPILLQESGIFEIPEIDITWFDPSSKRYQSQVLKKEVINVRQSNLPLITAPGGQQTVRLLGQDVQFINTNPSLSSYCYYYQNFTYWFIIFIVLGSLIIHYYFVLDSQKLNNDLFYRRNRRANSAIKKYFKDAQKYAKQNSDEFYNSAYIGLSHFLTDKLNLPRGSVEKLIFDELKERKISEPLLKELEESFKKINYVKFSSSKANSATINQDILTITELLNSLMVELNKKIRK